MFDPLFGDLFDFDGDGHATEMEELMGIGMLHELGTQDDYDNEDDEDDEDE